MPGRDGTGPRGEGPMTGRRGGGLGFGQGYGLSRGGRGVTQCTCPNCGNTIPHKKGTPCSNIDCPKCGTQMRGNFCLGDLNV